MLKSLFGSRGRSVAPSAPASKAAAGTDAAPAFVAALMAVRADRRLHTRDYATLAEAIVGDIRDNIGGGWLLACWLEESIDHYLRRAGIDPETLNRAELRVAIRARRDVRYIQKQRIKTDARFDELRDLVRATYRGDPGRMVRVLSDKVAVYHVAALADARAGAEFVRDAPAPTTAPIRAPRPPAGPPSGLRPVSALPTPVRRAPVADGPLFGERRRAA